MAADLDTYIAQARKQQLSDEAIKATLINAGWQQQQIDNVFQQHNPVAISPPPAPSVGMWTGFLYILFFISLYVLATSIGALFHDMVDKMIPDIKTTYDPYLVSDNTSLIRGAIAAIIVSFPIFASLALILRRQLLKNPTVANLRSRKILIYITLVGTFLIMLCHVIFIIYSFLDGKLTMNACGHLLVTFLIAGSIFGYFITEVKHDRK